MSMEPPLDGGRGCPTRLSRKEWPPASESVRKFVRAGRTTRRKSGAGLVGGPLGGLGPLGPPAHPGLVALAGGGVAPAEGHPPHRRARDRADRPFAPRPELQAPDAEICHVALGAV